VDAILHARGGGVQPARIQPVAMTSPFVRRFRLLGLLRGSLVAGALVTAPGVPARILKLPLPPLPEGRFYLWIMAVFLLMLAALYLAAAYDPRRYSAIIAVAIGGRALGAAVFTAAVLTGSGLGGLVPLAVADLAFSILHAASWWPIRS